MPCSIRACRRLHPAVLAAVWLAAALPVEVHAAPAGEPWDGPAFSATPAAMAQAAAGVPAGEGGVAVLLSEARYSYDAAGLETYTYRLVYRIASATAHESWSAVEERWSPWHQERPRLRARVIMPDGSEHALDPATVTENAEAAESPDMFEDGRVLRAPLPAIRPGSVVEQEVVVRETAPFFDRGTVRYHTLPMSVPVRLARLILEAPAGTPLRWTTRLMPGATPREETANGRRRLTFELRELAPIENAEPGLPADAPRSPYIAFSTGSSWAEIAQRYSEIVDRTVRGADLQAFLRAAGGPAGSQLETMDLYLRKLADEVRYTGIELGEGGLVPRTPAEVLRRKFGDCKDKAVLLVAMLRASDIPAYVALLSAGEDEQDVEESLPGMGAFNHAIVVVPGNPAVWIDPTDPYARAGALPVEDQGRLALIASPTTTGLVRTPEAVAADNREVETREVFLAELGPARVVETTSYRGATERDLRSFYAASEPDDLRSSLADYVKSEYGAKDLADMKHSDLKDLSQPLELRLEATEVQRGQTGISDAAVAVFPSDLLDRLPDVFTAGDEEEDEEPAPRRSDYVFTRPFQAEMRYRVVPPAGFAPQQPLPPGRTRTWGPVTLSEAYAAEKETGVVTATVKLDVPRPRLSPKEFEALREGVQEVLAEKPVLLLFDQTGESHLAAGRVREALQEHQSLAASAPGKALPRTRIARALLAGGLGEEALREAREAVRLEPGLAAAQRNLGWVLEHDALGRRFGKGWDRKGSIAAYRKAIELDPDDEIARSELAILLEHDAEGRRYSPTADLAAAIDEYRKLRKDLETEDMDDNLAVALLRAGRFEELRTFLGEIDQTDTRRVLRLSAATVLDGPDSAVREAERALQGGEPRMQALSNAAQNLIMVRRYAEAAALLERASRLSANPAALLSRAELLRRVKKTEELDLPASQPASVVRRMMIAGASGRLDGKILAPLFTRDLAQEIQAHPDQVSSRIAQEVGAKRRQLDAGDIPVDVVTDLGVAAFRENVSGDDKVGYRVRLVNSVGQGPAELVTFVVQEDGQYRITAFQNNPGRLGREALRLLDAENLPAARQWLDWAHELLAGKGSSSDPLPEVPFLALWQRGAQAEAGEIRCAAASLMAEDYPTPATADLLRACREKADAAKRTAFDVAVAHTLRSLGKLDELSPLAQQLLAAAPASQHAFALAAGALSGADRWDEAGRLAEERLRRDPDDLPALRILSDADERKGNFEGAEQRLVHLVDTGRGTALDFNNLAWLALLRDRADEQAIERAQRAATLSQYTDYGSLHTLASLYAETGRTAEAYRILLQALAARTDDEPGSSDWYVLGRLAEHYGLPDVARRYYEKVEAPAAENSATSTYALARRRLETLGQTAQAQRAGR
jgi:tetratricopeptide (TPR) repeat protein/transglutaminase-like putative cysteine protease